MEEEINFLAFSNDEIFISRNTIRKIDFNGNVIENNEDKIRTKSIWMVNLKTDIKKKLLKVENLILMMFI